MFIMYVAKVQASDLLQDCCLTKLPSSSYTIGILLLYVRYAHTRRRALSKMLCPKYQLQLWANIKLYKAWFKQVALCLYTAVIAS
jgi:hypothetical protein